MPLELIVCRMRDSNELQPSLAVACSMLFVAFVVLRGSCGNVHHARLLHIMEYASYPRQVYQTHKPVCRT